MIFCYCFFVEMRSLSIIKLIFDCKVWKNDLKIVWLRNEFILRKSLNDATNLHNFALLNWSNQNFNESHFHAQWSNFDNFCVFEFRLTNFIIFKIEIFFHKLWLSIVLECKSLYDQNFWISKFFWQRFV